MDAQPKTFIYKKVPGCNIRADLYRPPGADGPVPAVVYIHGGALIAGSRQEVGLQHLDRYLAAGYAVVAFDYRLAPQAKVPDILEDVDDAFRWIHHRQADLGVDASRLAVVGHSAGGYLTLAAGTRVLPRPRALVSFYGYGDLAAEWYAKPDPFYCRQPLVTAEAAAKAAGQKLVSHPQRDRWPFYLYCRQNGLWPKEVAGLDPYAQRDELLKYCPQYNVPADYPPTLLLHGDADTDVPYRQSTDMAVALSLAGIEHELITIPDGGHGFDCDKSCPARVQALDRVIAFLARHLQQNESANP
jgi:acetyl esterase/lipase